MRAERPFVAVNCAAIPENLLESEHFGHGRGTFTGAHSARAGMFQLANHGTILLDEVGELPLPLQAKLLRVLQDGEVRPMGSDQPVTVNVRLIASTNKDLAHQVEKGSFREDLFFCLQVVPIHLPPLRARRSDIPLLINHFLERFNRNHRLSVTISRQAMIYLWEYDWPGNIRELKNICPSVPVILLTARDDMTTRAAAMDLGVSEFVAKPVNNRDLLNRIRTQLNNLAWNKTANQVVSKIEKSTQPPENKK